MRQIHGIMKFYDLDDVFTFGKYEGMTIAEVFEKDPKYIKYCEENIDEFYVSPALKRDLKSLGRAISDSALLDKDFDKMSDDEIEKFMHSMDEDDEFSEDKLEDEFDWDNADIPDDSLSMKSKMNMTKTNSMMTSVIPSVATATTGI